MDAERIADYLEKWLKDRVQSAGAEGVVLGVSGGVDSAVAAVIAKRAFPDQCLALLLPCESHVSDLLHAQKLVEEFGIPYRIVELDNAFRVLYAQFASLIKLQGEKDRLLKANIKPRLRMIALYYSAQARNYLVLGTSNKSEISIGYCTKYGDNAVDLQLLGDLYKSEVYELARFLKVPDIIINKPPSGGLWSGQTDESEMQFTYAELEKYIQGERQGLQNLERIEMMERASQHKRKLPEIAAIPRA